MSALPLLTGDPAMLTQNWEANPFIGTGTGEFDAVFSVETIEGLLSSGTLPLPTIRLVRDGKAVPAENFGLWGERKAGRERLVDGPAVLREIQAGATLVVEELQTYSPEIAAFARQLTEETGFRTYCAAFATPGEGRGMAPHYDPASVFIRQVHGAKRWQVRRPLCRWPSRAWSPSQDTDTELVLETVLRPGQCLYIPRGFVHCGTAMPEASVHLSIGLLPRTWAWVLRRLTDAALDAEPLREALPCGFHRLDAEQQRELLAERLAELTRRLGQLGAGPEADQAPAAAQPRASARSALAPGSLRAILG